MPHLKCVRCRIRIRGQQNSAGGAGELCPECGSPLEPVHDIAELIGMQSRAHPDELEAISDAARWLDDGGSITEAVAMALPPPPPQSQGG